MAKVEPTRIKVVYGANHKKSLWSAFEILKSKVTVETVDSKVGNKSPVNDLKRD